MVPREGSKRKVVDNSLRAEYEIKVEGDLDLGWENWFSGFDITLSYACDQAPVTTLTGPVADQAALRGMLCKLWDLNLTLLSVHRMAGTSKKEKENA
jgi:hypothetical protein